MYQIPRPEALRQFFLTNATKSISFRKEQLLKLKATILHYEESLYDALYKDLKKSKEESWATEIGIVVSEIELFLKRIDDFTTPQRVGTNLINQPGKSYIVSDPLGVVLIIAPWNYPFQLCLLPLVGAIAAGNCVILKPSELAVATESIVQKIIVETFASDFVSCATGDGAAVVSSMLSHFRFDHIFYTGSPAVGRIIYQQAAEQLIPVTLELGGKNPCVITRNADLKLAARRIALGKFINAGQTCVAPDYLLVHRSVKEKFLTHLQATIQAFYCIHPVESYDFGRIINSKQFRRLMGYIENSHVVFGGTYNDDILYISPTIIEVSDINAPIMQEEIFGPILPIFTYENEDEALGVIRNNENPLAFYIFTNDKREADSWLQQVPSGGACINSVAMHYLNKNLPFGGRGKSGTGRYHGQFSFETFSHRKGVLQAATWPDLKIVYPSFKEKLGLVKKFFK